MPFGLFVLQLGGGVRASIWGLVLQAGPFAKGVLIILLVMSVICWAAIWDRLRLFRRVEKADQSFLASFRRLPRNADFRLVCEQHPHSLLARVAMIGQRALDQHAAAGFSASAHYELIQRAMDRGASEEIARLERHVGFLATTGSVSPFIGLMGTVWGVMTSFLNIGAQGSASLVVVAPGIAEALIATIAGLAAAIPAVVGYNHLLGRLRDFQNATAQFSTEFLDQRVGGTAP
ncbi:MAG: MotA/TolQ/ExbB proton channel family protein [Candidatus Eisenbacteria bacterium]|uniref:MotA/TolQ/ExbB proton channel family protein n=1 Tax=Eiseniibacteriota bacterium TaxID=2212470 RepID=A0A9D6L4U1_UNCEI|nr:MotA/TolQ/ExbB proton channel family protein [Candidatus Eisenbacteria bacterium]MBI3539847.1 MotA/TolQ/ExbB proton channel family protein [Candidatus Eisenbacteria bacterium]